MPQDISYAIHLLIQKREQLLRSLLEYGQIAIWLTRKADIVLRVIRQAPQTPVPGLLDKIPECCAS